MQDKPIASHEGADDKVDGRGREWATLECFPVTKMGSHVIAERGVFLPAVDYGGGSYGGEY